MANGKYCKLCEEPIPKLALAFSNGVAIENGYCCWICMLSDLGTDKAFPILEKKAKVNQAARIKARSGTGPESGKNSPERPQGERSQGG